METSKYGSLIKTGKGNIKSCTLTQINEENKSLEFLGINFRKAIERTCGVLFYEFNGSYYYPLSMEFRLIDNNVLFLIRELGISTFSELAALLTSSFKREESRDVDFFAVIYKLKAEPSFSIKIDGFIFDEGVKVVEVVDE